MQYNIISTTCTASLKCSLLGIKYNAGFKNIYYDLADFQRHSAKSFNGATIAFRPLHWIFVRDRHIVSFE